MYTIIQDCSPYYIRFTHLGIEEVIDTCINLTKDVDFVKWKTHTNGFTQYRPPTEEAKVLLSKIPMSKQFDFWLERVALFVTQPGRYYKAHKDGLDDRISINYTVKILDDTCVTSWYSDEELKEYTVEGHDWKLWRSRECAGFDKNSSTRHTPLKSMTAVAGECILFNTNIFHAFDNSRSTHERIVLTFRLKNPGVHYFTDVKKTLFGI